MQTNIQTNMQNDMNVYTVAESRSGIPHGNKDILKTDVHWAMAIHPERLRFNTDHNKGIQISSLMDQSLFLFSGMKVSSYTHIHSLQPTGFKGCQSCAH